MTIPNIIKLFELVISEQKIVLVSSYLQMLTIVSETLCSWLFPFYWHHILIPVLPARLLNYLQAPVPFIIGVHRNYFDKDLMEEAIPHDTIIVDIDNNTIEPQTKHVSIPSRERRKLISKLETCAKTVYNIPALTSLWSKETPKKLAGVPETIKQAYIDNSFSAKSCESHITQRKIQDIPKVMYRKYGNHFLQVKSGNAKIGINPNISGLSADYSTPSSNQVSKSSDLILNIQALPHYSSARESTTSIASFGNLNTAPQSARILESKPFKYDISSLRSISEAGRRSAIDTSNEITDSENERESILSSQEQSNNGTVESYEASSGVSQRTSTEKNIKSSNDNTQVSDNKSIDYTNSTRESSNDNSELQEYSDSDENQPEVTWTGVKRTQEIEESTKNVKSIQKLSIRTKKYSETPGQISEGSQSEISTATAIAPRAKPLFGKDGTMKIWWANIVAPSKLKSPSLELKNSFADETGVNGNLSNIKQQNTSASVDDAQKSFGNLCESPRPHIERKINFLDRFMSQKSGNEVTPDPHKLKTHPQNSFRDILPEPPVIYKDGHVYHELVPLIGDREVDIEVDDDENLVDRFPSESDSDDERSEMSTIQDFGFISNSRNLPIKKNSTRPVGTQNLNKKSQLTPIQIIRTESVKHNPDICKVCRDRFNDEKILMCERKICYNILDCHIQIHATCIEMTDEIPCPLVFNEEKIRGAFFSIFTSLFRNYRLFLNNSPNNKSPSGEDYNSTSDVFRQEPFIAEFDSDSKPFIRQIVQSQAFSQFVLERLERSETDYEILFFDESIKAKLNRSKLRFSKELTPFLKDDSYQITSSISCLTPNYDNLCMI